MNKTNVIKIDPNKPDVLLLTKAAEVILKDHVIGYPTETIYGLGANALSERAIEKVFELKGRDKSKPILIIAYDIEQVKKMVVSFPGIAEILAHVFWPGALTIVLKASPALPGALLGDGNRLGIRIPDNNICLELLKICGVPITSTSANISGLKNPISAQEVFENFANKLALIIDGGPSPSRTPSTVVSVEDDQVNLIREGAIPRYKLEQAIGKITDEKKER